MTREEALLAFNAGVQRARESYRSSPIISQPRTPPGASKPVCIDCLEKPVRSKGRCDTCYRHARKDGVI